MKKFLLLICCVFCFQATPSKAVTIVSDTAPVNFSLSLGYYDDYYCHPRYYGTSWYYKYCPYYYDNYRYYYTYHYYPKRHYHYHKPAKHYYHKPIRHNKGHYRPSHTIKNHVTKPHNKGVSHIKHTPSGTPHKGGAKGGKPGKASRR